MLFLFNCYIIFNLHYFSFRLYVLSTFNRKYFYVRTHPYRKHQFCVLGLRYFVTECWNRHTILVDSLNVFQRQEPEARLDLFSLGDPYPGFRDNNKTKKQVNNLTNKKQNKNYERPTKTTCQSELLLTIFYFGSLIEYSKTLDRVYKKRFSPG